MTDRLEGLNPSDIAGYLNREFKGGNPAYLTLPLIRAFSRPICIDYNNVLVNNWNPLTPNPQAREVIDTLSKIGNVFIVTTAPDWQRVHTSLSKFGLWKNDMVLLCSPNYEFIGDTWRAESQAIIREYIDFMGANGTHIDPRDFNIHESSPNPDAYKKIAPLFLKPFSVPIIDDSPFATEYNPGMLGLRVKGYVTDDKEPYIFGERAGVELTEVPNFVGHHYQNISLR